MGSIVSYSTAVRYLALVSIVIGFISLAVEKAASETLIPWVWIASLVVTIAFWVLFASRARVGNTVETNVFRGLVALYIFRYVCLTLWLHPWISLMNRFAESGYRLELVRGVIRSVSVVIAISWFSIAAALVMLALALRERRLGSNLNPSKLSVEYGALIVASVGIVCQLCGLVVYFSNISLGFLDFGWILYDFAWMFFFLVVWTDVRALHWLTGGPRADSQGGVGVVAWTKEDL